MSIKITKSTTLLLSLLTLLYWGWESQAEGNIRVDLLVIYPLLFISYLCVSWKSCRFYSFLIAIVLMLLNIAFFMLSYDLFGKSPG